MKREWIIPKRANVSARKIMLETAGDTIELVEGTVVEEHVQIVNPEDRNYAVVFIPLAAGLEPLNPHLATSPPEAVPSGQLTQSPDYMEMRDHYVAYYYNSLPRGTYDFYFRTSAMFPGTFTQPGAYSRLMYNFNQTGASPGVYVSISPSE